MMNSRLTLWLVVAATLTLAGSAMANEEADLSGTWTVTLLDKSATGAKDGELTFERDGFELQVTMKSAKGSVKSIGFIDGNEIRFYHIRPGKKGDVTVKFTGHVRGDLMGGQVDMGKQGTTTWKATRGPEKGSDLSGIWTLQMKGESPSGLDLVKMSFTQDGHKLIVTLHGETSDVECEGYAEDGTVTFYYVRTTGGEKFVARFSGHVAGALMGGEVDMGDLGKTTWRATQDI